MLEVQAERAKLAAEVEEDLLDTYQRLFETKDAGGRRADERDLPGLPREVADARHPRGEGGESRDAVPLLRADSLPGKLIRNLSGETADDADFRREEIRMR